MTDETLPSREMVEGPARAPARAMLHAAGFDDKALTRPLVAIVHSFSTVTPCNMHLRDLAQHAARGIEEAGGTPIEFGAIGDDELKAVERHACPGAGACGGQFTANTMALAMSFLGLSPMGLNDIPAVHPHKAKAAYEAGRLTVEALRGRRHPRDLITPT